MKLKRLFRRATSVPAHGHARLRRRIDKLERQLQAADQRLTARVHELETGLEEQRRLSLRVAELSDFVAEVVGASARGDRTELDAALQRYSDGI